MTKQIQHITPEALTPDMVRELTAAIRELSKAVAASNAQPATFVGADEAARIIGIPVSTSGNHRNRLTAAYKRGIFPKSIPGRPFQFHRGEMEQAAKDRASGKLYL